MLENYYQDPKGMIDFFHGISKESENVDFHMHNRFEIYFFITGNLNYFIEKNVYQLKHGDLFIINSSEVHKPYFKSKGDYERLVIHFDPSIALAFSSPGFDLLKCFVDRPKGKNNKISLNRTQIEEMLRLFSKIENVIKFDYSGSEILKLLYFVEMLIYINRVYSNQNQVDENIKMPDKLVAIFDYINDNLGEDLSLEFLAGEFFINKYYLCRLFKNIAGTSIHEYIIYKRISRAKELLLNNQNVTEVHQQVGFNDYSNFLRAFKRIVGKSPGKYKKENEIYTK